jgi:hypothetical protein
MTEPTGEPVVAVAAPEAAAVAVEEAPAYKLFPLKHIWAVSVFGGPLPGAWMMAANYKRLGQTAKSHLAAGLGALAIVLVVALNYAITRNFGETGNLPFGFVLAAAVRQLAGSQQGRAIGEHERRGGVLESAWKSFGIMLVGIVQTLFGAAVLVGWLQTSVVVGGTHEIILDGMATEADARRMGDVLVGIALPEGKETKTLLEKDRSSWTVTINVKREYIDEPDLARIFEPIAQHLRAFAFPDGLALKLVLANGLHKKICELDGAEHLACR